MLDDGGVGRAEVTRASVDASAMPDPAIIATSAPPPSARQPSPIGEPVVVSLIRAPEAAETAASPEAEPPLPETLVRVTGSRVNMRAGPSVADGVVDSLPRGTLAEPVGEPRNGWQQIRDVETGMTGWMFARYLAPA
jgi:hypothetical protein